jgi:hypothetical protein
MDDWRKWQLILAEETGWFGKPIQTRDGGEEDADRDVHAFL